MSSTTPHTILLFRNAGYGQHIQEKEAEEAITPGMLIEINPTTGSLRRHSTEDGTTQKMIALENPYDDDTSTAAIDSAYGTADAVRFIYGVQGDKVYAKYAAGGTSLSENDPLVSAGDGTLKSTTVDATTLEGAVVGYAEEDVGGTTVRVRMRVA